MRNNPNLYAEELQAERESKRLRRTEQQPQYPPAIGAGFILIIDPRTGDTIAATGIVRVSNPERN